MNDQENEPDVVNAKSISSLQASISAGKWSAAKKEQLSEKSAMCDRVGLVLALCPRYFLQEQLDDKLIERVGDSTSC